MTPRSLTHRSPLLGLVVAWGIGSALVHLGGAPWSPRIWAMLALGGLALAVLAHVLGPRFSACFQIARPTFLAGLALALAAAGALRTSDVRGRLAEWDALSLPPREARLELRVERAFASRQAGRASGLARVVSAGPHLADLVGQRVQFSAAWPEEAAAPLRGARFSALGLLAPLPRLPEAGSFERFLADEGANFTFNRARLEGPVHPAGPWTRLYASAGQRLEDTLRHGLESRPHLADLYVAMLLGRKQALSREQRDWFVRSGTMHLFAISGLHVAAIAVAFHTLLILARVPSRPRFLAGTLLLWLYVEITGGQPSAIRAFWMITCLLGARQLRAPTNSLSALCASALGVLIVSPHQLFGAGFQMSYGIVAAILLYGVPLQEKWQAGWRPWALLPAESRRWTHTTWEEGVRLTLAALALGLAATLISTPATLGFFGLVAPGAFFVNLLLVPAASLVIFSGVASMLAGLVGLAPVSVLFNHSAGLVLALMEGSVVAALGVPGSSLPAQLDPPWLPALGGLGILALLALGYARRWPEHPLGAALPYGALAIFLALGLSFARMP